MPESLLLDEFVGFLVGVPVIVVDHPTRRPIGPFWSATSTCGPVRYMETISLVEQHCDGRVATTEIPLVDGPRPPMRRERTDEREADWRARQAAMGEPWRIACHRAEALLRGCLSPEQLHQLDSDGSFNVEGARQVYRIRRGRVGNVDVMDEAGNATLSLCCHSRGLMPDADTMLVQKLLLETDEERFLDLANPHEPPR